MMLCKYCHEEAFEDYEFCSQECHDDYYDHLPMRFVGRTIMTVGIFAMIVGSGIPGWIAFLTAVPLSMILFSEYQELRTKQKNTEADNGEIAQT